MEISPQIKYLIKRIEERSAVRERFRVGKNEEVISVDNIASKLAALYEKLRNSVDYKEEHLIRRGAIERMLRRQTHESFRKGNVARILIVEMVRAGYLPNNTLPIKIIDDVGRIIKKYTKLKSVCVNGNMPDIMSRIIELEATEIEEYLFPPISANATADAFYLTVKDVIDIKGAKSLTKEQKDVQIYVACYRSLLRYDEPSLFYRMWLLNHPDWNDMDLSDDVIIEVAQNFDIYEQEISDIISNPLNWKITHKLRDLAIYFSLIKESIDKQPDLWTENNLTEESLKEQLSFLLNWKFKVEKKNIMRTVKRVIIYIILTKIILAVCIELPYEIFILKDVNELALFINIVFHPLLLYIVTLGIKFPKEDLREQTIKGIIDIVEGNLESFKLRVVLRRKRSLFGAILIFIYFTIFIATFGGIIWILKILKFNFVSGGLFLLFLSIVSYFGLRIRNRARRWRITPKKTTVKEFLIDLITMPVVHTGQWISEKFSSINVFVFTLDFFIETPFQLIVEIFEGFIHFLKEKKEELD